MARKLDPEAIQAFLASHPAWSGDAARLSRTYAFEGYAAAVGFTMSVAMTAERRDHHPDILLSWGRVEVRWSTHDVGGVSDLDVELARATDALYVERPA